MPEQGLDGRSDAVYQDDAISGAEFVRRPGLAALLNALNPRPPFQVLVMAEQSRLGRAQIETAYTIKRIIDAGVRVWYYLDDSEALLDSAPDKFMTALASFAGETHRERPAPEPTMRCSARRRPGTSPAGSPTATRTSASRAMSSGGSTNPRPS